MFKAQLAGPGREAVGAEGLRNGDVLIGTALAGHFGVRPGGEINLRVGDTVMRFRVAAVFSGRATIWQRAVGHIDSPGCGQTLQSARLRLDFLIYCRPGPGNIQAVRQDALTILGDLPYRLQTKSGDVAGYVDKGFREQQGVFTVFYLLAFSVGVPAVLIASGLGFSDRGRTIGICKAIGWQTTDIMVLVMFEQVLLSLIAACLAFLASYVWIRLFNGAIVARFFISDIGSIAAFPVPASFGVMPLALAGLLCLTITLSGGLYTTWRLASHPPADSIR